MRPVACGSRNVGVCVRLFLNLPAVREINKELCVHVVSNFGRVVYIHVGILVGLCIFMLEFW